MVAQNVRWAFRTIFHYLEATLRPGTDAPELKVIGQLVLLSNYSFDCKAVVPLLANSTIKGVVANIAGYNVRIRNPEYNHFIINGTRCFQGLSDPITLGENLKF